ncbi:MAG: carboxypeptidase-like regulatory domain-containing protein [Bacteroidetes bacterium]|nr:carboxypeptidase-like regulatory domain-containing protein [Bacteroidota bacterium]
MEHSISNSVNMINTTVTYCDNNSAATAGITNFAIVLGFVKGKLVLVNALNQIAEGKTGGVTTDTNLLRKTMTDAALKCANATLGYANSVNNNTLKAKVNYTEAKLNKFKKEEVDDVCQTIHDATDDNFALAAPFGIVATDVTDLQTAINVYRTATQNPRNAIISRSQAKKQVKAMVKDIDENLLGGQMDTMVNTLKVSNRNYWDGYQQARETINLGSTSAKVRGTALDINDTPIKGVVFAIYETGTTVKVADVKTDIKGKYIATKLPAGNFDFKWSKDGYKTLTEEDVHISAGKELRRKVVMNAVIVREGDLAMGIFTNIDLTGIGEGITQVTVTAKDSPMRFYATNNPANAAGAVFIEVPAGMSMIKTVAAFTGAVGLNDTNSFLNVQNAGVVAGHWGISFE